MDTETNRLLKEILAEMKATRLATERQSDISNMIRDLIQQLFGTVRRWGTVKGIF